MPSEARPADEVECANPKVPQARSAMLRVRDVMVASPKTMQATATVADVRQAFANPHVRSALLVDGSRFAGVINREHVPEAAADTDPASDYASIDVPTISPDAPVSDAVAQLDSTGEFRLVALAKDGVTLAGLVCLDKSRTGFCQPPAAHS